MVSKATEWKNQIDLALANVKSDHALLDFLYDLVSYGYLPHQLPPPFSTADLGKLIMNDIDNFYLTIKNELLGKNGIKTAESSLYFLARPSQLRRALHIVPPFQYALLCLQVVSYWTELIAAAKGSGWAMSFPIINLDPFKEDSDRAILFQHPWKEHPQKKLKARSHSRHMVKADISRFFPSIYTHSVPWALHSKSVAKKDRSLNLLGNRLDELCRSMQDGQTLGIPIGPDTSSIISEIILANIDVTLRKYCNNAVRSVDDYEIYCDSKAGAEKALSVLQSSLKDYELELNTLKTKILTLPESVDSPELSLLKNFEFPHKKPSVRQLILYFDCAFVAYNANTKAGVLRYALRRLDTDAVGDDDSNQVFIETGLPLDTFVDFMCQCIVSEPGTIEYALRIIAKRERSSPGDITDEAKDSLAACLKKVIAEHSSLNHSSEVCWAIWGMMLLKSKIPNDLAKSIASMGDNASLLMLLDAKSKGLVIGKIYFKGVLSRIYPADFYSKDWLLAYEGLLKGWIGGKKTNFATDALFQYLYKNKVSFYKQESLSNYLNVMANWAPLDFNYQNEDEHTEQDEDEECPF